MLVTVVVAALVASSLPCAHTLRLWPDPRDYFQYLLTKECFGEEIALQQEKEAMQHAEYCEQRPQEDSVQSEGPVSQAGVPGVSTEEHFPSLDHNTVDPARDPSDINHSAAKRSLMKFSRDATLDVMLCNLRQFKLLTDDNRVNFSAVEDRLQGMKINPQLKLNLLQSAILCRPSSTSSQRENSSDRATLVGTILAVARYQGCISSKTLSICKEFVGGQVASKLHL